MLKVFEKNVIAVDIGLITLWLDLQFDSIQIQLYSITLFTATFISLIM